MSTSVSHAVLDGIPRVDLRSNLQQAASATKRGLGSLVGEALALRHGPGKFTGNEYFYFRLWENDRTREDKRRFVGKLAQSPMHRACVDTAWRLAADDKLLFHALMTGAGFPVPELLGIVHPSRGIPGVFRLTNKVETAAFLSTPDNYPLFAKPIGGKYSLGVLSADGYDVRDGCVALHDGGKQDAGHLAVFLGDNEDGYMLQRRLEPHHDLKRQFGACLWSARLLMLLTPDGPILHRAVVKIATGSNPADNFWRYGNMLGAINLANGQVTRVVSGVGATMAVNSVHPDTGKAIVGTSIPDWPELVDIVMDAATLFPGIRTQSWDVALSNDGPVPLEVNWGGDLNLSQLASGVGVLDQVYRDHLTRCGYRR